MPNTIKGLVLKLGGDCNLSCTHCHCLKNKFEFNEDIYKFIEGNTIETITFSGGEPLLYWLTIKSIAERLGKKYRYRFVTNGTLLTPDMLDFLNDYEFTISFSYDGQNSSRDGSSDIRYNYIEKLNNYGVTVTCYNNNTDIVAIKNDIKELMRIKFNNPPDLSYFFPNFIHQTSIAPNNDVTINTAKEYVVQLAQLLELDMIAFKNGAKIKELPILSGLLFRWFRSDYHVSGVRCCNENVLNLNVAGEFMLCPYSYKLVGNIYDGVDWSQVINYLPARCIGCNILHICKNQCIENITENECFIFKVMYKHIHRLFDKYNIGFSDFNIVL